MVLLYVILLLRCKIEIVSDKRRSQNAYQLCEMSEISTKIQRQGTSNISWRIAALIILIQAMTALGELPLCTVKVGLAFLPVCFWNS